MKVWIVLLTLSITPFLVQHSFAQYATLQDEYTIPITQSTLEMEKINFDGKWSFVTEWKATSWNKLVYDDGNVIHFRNGHLDDFIYILIDFQTDENLDHNLDKATLCFDSENNKSTLPDEDDYCFSVSLNQKEGTVFQGDSSIHEQGYFKKIQNPNGFIAVSSPSDENDRYSLTPHSSYEFRIPINLIGRSDNYGFFLSVYEANSETFYNWPQEVSGTDFELTSPENWGNLISPDKSLPEFEIPLVILFSSIFFIILLSKKWNPLKL